MKITTTSTARLGLALGVSAFVAPLAIQSYSAEASSATTPQVRISATLEGLNGLPLGHTLVRLDNLVAGPDGREVTRPLTETLTNRRGTFYVAADAWRLKKDATGSYMLELETIAAPAASGFVYDFRALPPRRTSGRWTVEMPPVIPESRRLAWAAGRPETDRVLARSVGAATTPLVFQVRRGLVASGQQSSIPGTSKRTIVGPDLTNPPGGGGSGTLGGFSGDMVAPPGETSTAETTDGSGTETLPSGDYWVDPISLAQVSDPLQAQSKNTSCRATEDAQWQPIDSYRYNWVPTKWGKTESRGSLRWKIGQTQQTDLQGVIDIAGDYGTLSFMGSESETSSIDAEPKIPNNSRQLVEMHWKYQKEQKICVPAAEEQGAYGLNVYRWVPDQWTGGNRLLDTSSGVSCGGSGPAYHDTYGSTTTLSKDTTVTYDAFYTIANVELDVKQADTSAQTFSIIPNSGTNVNACGSDGSPLVASFAKEDGD